jgi:predicted GIY-YIG superfamily endonuclease
MLVNSKSVFLVNFFAAVSNVGFTENLNDRLRDHNYGKNPHTAKSKPWKIKTAIAFSDRQKALDFERYLKTPSGRAFAKKRL